MYTIVSLVVRLIVKMLIEFFTILLENHKQVKKNIKNTVNFNLYPLRNRASLTRVFFIKRKNSSQNQLADFMSTMCTI